MSDTEILTRILQQITKQNELLQTLVDSIAPIYGDGERGAPVASLLANISTATMEMASGGKQRPRMDGGVRRDAGELPFGDDDQLPAPVCEIHSAEMRPTKKNPRVFYCFSKAEGDELRNDQGYCTAFATYKNGGIERWHWKP